MFKGDNMDGIILINKPSGMTSHDVVNKLRKILKTKKVKLLQCLSLSSGLLAMYCTIYDYNYLVSIQDWSALLDTSAFISKITFLS